jgi:hypothetical protein
VNLRTRIQEDMKAAMRAREQARLSAIRLLLAALQQREVDERKELAEVEVISVVEKLIKQRRESVAQYEQAGRTELADAERFEIGVLQAYLPQALGQADVDAAIDAAVAESGAHTVKDMGKVMALLKARLAGRADMGRVSAQVRTKLGG